jgi:hypothetical protein
VSHNLRRLLRPLPILIIVAVATLIVFDRPLIRGDGVAYLAWVDSIALDRDIDLANQVERLQPVLTYQILWNENTGRWAIVFPFGVAFLQAPFYLIGHGFAVNGWLNLNPDYFYQMQGVGLPYSLWLMIGANLMALGAMLFAYFAGRHLCGDVWAAVVAYVVFLGTPLFYYSTISPLNSHNPGAFAASGFVYLLVRLTNAFSGEDASLNRRTCFCMSLHSVFLWALLGIFAGLTILSRWQLALVIAPGFALLAWERRWRGLVIAGTAAMITLLPLPLIFQWMFGSPFTIPYNAVEGEAFLRQSNHAWDVLIQTIIHSPVIALSLIGLFFLWHINRRWAVMTAAMIGLQITINGAALDWWAGESYGMRRMSELYPIYALLICAALSASATRDNPQAPVYWAQLSRFSQIVLVIIIPYTFLYILAFLDYTWTNQQGWFLSAPEVMIGHFFNQPNRFQILREVIHSHVGPWAWAMPGP